MTDYFVGANHEAVREWYQKGRRLFAEAASEKEEKAYCRGRKRD
jgi:hypothetical protein